jgi:hypothetical protein
MAQASVWKIKGEKGMIWTEKPKIKDERETFGKIPARLRFGMTPIILRTGIHQDDFC